MEELRSCLLSDIPATLRGHPIVLHKPEEDEPAHPLVWLGTDGFRVKEEELPLVEMDMPAEDGKKFYEGVYTVCVLSDRPQGEICGPQALGELMRECNSGDFVGELVSGLVREVTPIHMAELLLQAGSAPDFFQIDDAESLVNTLLDSASDEGCSPDLIVVSKQAFNELLEGVGLGRHKFDIEEEDES
jgi:hypothetical protein